MNLNKAIQEIEILKLSNLNSKKVEIGEIFYAVEKHFKNTMEVKKKSSIYEYGKVSQFAKWYTSNGYSKSYVSDYKKAYYLFSILKNEEDLQEHSHNLSFQKIRLLTKSEHADSLDLIIKILKIDMENNSIPYKKMKEYLDGRVIEFDKVFNLFSEIKIQLKHYSKEDRNDLAESLDNIEEQLKSIVLNEKIRAKIKRKNNNSNLEAVKEYKKNPIAEVELFKDTPITTVEKSTVPIIEYNKKSNNPQIETENNFEEETVKSNIINKEENNTFEGTNLESNNFDISKKDNRFKDRSSIPVEPQSKEPQTKNNKTNFNESTEINDDKCHIESIDKTYIEDFNDETDNTNDNESKPLQLDEDNWNIFNGL